MNFAEMVIKAIDKMKDNDGFFFHIVISEVIKTQGKKPAILKLQIDDEIADHLFKNLNDEARFGICIPKKIWLEIWQEDAQEIKEAESK